MHTACCVMTANDLQTLISAPTINGSRSKHTNQSNRSSHDVINILFFNLLQRLHIRIRLTRLCRERIVDASGRRFANERGTAASFSLASEQFDSRYLQFFFRALYDLKKDAQMFQKRRNNQTQLPARDCWRVLIRSGLDVVVIGWGWGWRWGRCSWKNLHGAIDRFQ